MTDDRFMSRQVFRIEAFAGDRKLDAYVIPPKKASSRVSPSLSRYDRLEPRAVPGEAYSMDGVTIIGVDLSEEEDLTAIWTREEPMTAQAWRRASARGQGKSEASRAAFELLRGRL